MHSKIMIVGTAHLRTREKETLMIVTNGRQSSRRPPVLVIGSELCLMFDLPPRDVRVDNDHIGAALMLEERGMFVPYGR